MATVYLARDVKHDRKVAIKVLHSELAVSLGAERFLREITIAANLSHPNILPLLDSGSAEETLFYVMPLVEGESLRDRIHREKQLPLEDALKITEQVAAALAYAHSRGVVHRDIKPDNIMLSSGQAVVADFGIARAVDAAGGEQLTQTGTAIGTPAYMSPEQSAGESDVDARSDIYALGCVLFEMLAGEPPYTGTTPGAIIAKRLSTPVPDVRVLRETVPDHIEAALRSALAKAPADRFTSATQFAEALRAKGVSLGPATGETQPIRITRRHASVVRRAVFGGVGVLAVLGFGWWATWGDGINGDLDPDAIAVMPFRVGGDPAYGYLRESMLDLLSARLTGGTGPRVLESRTTLNAWRRAANDDEDDLSEDDSRRVAAQLGAGQLLLGNVVATPTELALSASLLQVSDGTLIASGSAAGPPDSVAVLVNRLTAQLLSLEAGEARDRVEGLATTSLPALQEYLAGRNAYRSGDYIEALRLYGRAFALDSSFVQAGFGLVSINYWLGDAITMAGRFAGPAVWRLREQLSEGDRAFLLATPWVGPNYPLPSSFAELITQAEAGVTGSPKSPEHWLLLGQLLTIQGSYSGVSDWADRAAQALDRAIALDSSFAMAMQMRLFVALLQDDPEETRRIAAAYERLGATEFSGDLALWGAAVKLGDSIKTIAWRDRFDEFSQQNLYLMPMFSIRVGLPLSDAHRAHAVLRDLAATQGEVGRGSLGEVALAFAEGRVQDAVEGIEANTAWLPVLKNSHAISMALFEAPYREAATDVAARVAAVYPNVGPLPPPTGITEYQWPVLHDCHGELLRVVQGDTSRTRQAIRRLQNMTEEDQLPATLEVPSTTLEHGEVVTLDPRSLAELFINSTLASARIFPVCPLLLEVMLDGPARLDELDSLMQTGPQAADNMLVPAAFANLVIARMREAQGDIDGALAAVRRRSNELNPGFLWPLPVLLRQEGRLAAMAGDTMGAIRAYEHYLTLRTNPDPPFLPQRDSVVAELAALVGR
jgi:serine/threonine-protein kinase